MTNVEKIHFVLYRIRGSDKWNERTRRLVMKQWPNTKVKEWIAVTTKKPIRIPILIYTPDKNGMMEKVKEKMRPITKLKPGMRHMTHVTKLRAKKMARSMIKRAWGPSMKKIYGSKDVGLATLYQDYYSDGRNARIIKWNGNVQKGN